MNPRLLDLFCGAGGATRGYQRAGFYVIGVDNKAQPNYVGDEFVQADALTFPLDGFAVVHASPPCQRHSKSVSKANRLNHPDHIVAIRERFERWGGPWIIENVPSSPLVNYITLCRTMFVEPPTITVLRHRWFESNCDISAPGPCRHDEWPPRFPPAWNRKTPLRFVNASGGWGGHTFEERCAAMGIDWMTSTELSESIPPTYTEHIGRQVLSQL